MGNYTGLKGKASATAINRNKKTKAGERAEQRSALTGKHTFEVSLNGKTMNLTTEVKDGKVYLNGTSRYYDLVNNSVMQTLREHLQDGAKISMTN